MVQKCVLKVGEGAQYNRATAVLNASGGVIGMSAEVSKCCGTSIIVVAMSIDTLGSRQYECSQCAKMNEKKRQIIHL